MNKWKVPDKHHVTVQYTVIMSEGSNHDNQKTTTHKLPLFEISIEEYNRIFKKPKRKLNWFDKILAFRK